MRWIAVLLLALFAAAAPARAQILWQTGHESGDLSDWSRNAGGGVFNSGTGKVTVTQEAAHSGRYAAKMEVWSIDSSQQACRLFRWGEHLETGYFSAWLMFPQLPQVAGWLNVFQFKKKNYATGQVDPTWYNEVDNTSRGTVLTLTHWNQAWNIAPTASLPPALQAGKWFHVEWYYKDGISDGELRIWIDGQEVWHLLNVNTRGIDPDIQWAPVLYGQSVSPGYLVMYVDDAAISTQRVGTGSPAPTPNQAPVASVAVAPATGLAPLIVSLDGRASRDSDGQIVAHRWSFGDGGSSLDALAAHVYASAGSFTATLTVTDDDGASATASATVTVTAPVLNQAPTAAATANPSAGVAPLAVTFDGSGSTDGDGQIQTYAWSFGDGTTGSGAVAAHTYPTPGTYAVGLIVTDVDGASASASTTVAVQAPPAPTAGPVALWHFDEGAWTGAAGEVIDASGRGNGAAASGAVTAAAGVGRSGLFDGVDDRVVAPGGPSLSIQGQGLTLAAWVNFPSLPTRPMGILSHGGYYDGYRLLIAPTGAVTFELASRTYGSLVSQGRLSPGAWHHVAATFDGATMRIYIDGVRDPAQKARVAAVDASTGDLWIGHGDRVAGQWWSYPFAGRIDEVYLYDRGLSDAEVGALQAAASPTAGGTPPPSGDPNRLTADGSTVALYHFDGDLQDAGPNGLHLQAKGGAAVTADGAGGQVLRTRAAGDEVTAWIPDRLLLGASNWGALTLEARIYPRQYKAYGVGNCPIVSLAQNWDTRVELLDRKWSAARGPDVEGSRDVVLLNAQTWQSLVAPAAWHDLKIVCDAAGTASVYIDGARVNSASLSMNVMRSTDWLLRLGNFDGDIDELRVSDTARVPTGATRPAATLAGTVDDAGAGAEFGLSQSVPNPFNPSTTISYRLAVAAPVRLTVYNSVGQAVRVLVDAAQGPGAYRVTWDGRDEAGVEASAGVYFYRLTAGAQSATGRMLMAK